jgi:hypothetical protein
LEEGFLAGDLCTGVVGRRSIDPVGWCDLRLSVSRIRRQF